MPGLAVDSYIGNRLQPQLGGRIDGAEIGQFQAVQEILFDIADADFGAPLFVVMGLSS